LVLVSVGDHDIPQEYEEVFEFCWGLYVVLSISTCSIVNKYHIIILLFVA